MPKETFFNLPADKRQKILNVAIAEFAQNDYDSASISRMVANAGIAKGSFYQYFENKMDLYRYLFDLMAERKQELLNTEPPDPKMGIFDQMRWLAQAGVEFELAYPQLSQIGYRAGQGIGRRLLQAVIGARSGARGRRSGSRPGLGGFYFQRCFYGAGQIHVSTTGSRRRTAARILRLRNGAGPFKPDFTHFGIRRRNQIRISCPRGQNI